MISCPPATPIKGPRRLPNKKHSRTEPMCRANYRAKNNHQTSGERGCVCVRERERKTNSGHTALGGSGTRTTTRHQVSLPTRYMQPDISAPLEPKKIYIYIYITGRLVLFVIGHSHGQTQTQTHKYTTTQITRPTLRILRDLAERHSWGRKAANNNNNIDSVGSHTQLLSFWFPCPTDVTAKKRGTEKERPVGTLG